MFNFNANDNDKKNNQYILNDCIEKKQSLKENDKEPKIIENKIQSKIGLKTLLQNADLLDILLRKLKSNNELERSFSNNDNQKSINHEDFTASVLNDCNNKIGILETKEPLNDIYTHLNDNNVLKISEEKNLIKADALLDSNIIIGNDEQINILRTNFKDNVHQDMDFQENHFKESKALTINCGNYDETYGNAFLGHHIWDKSDLFKGDKIEVEFECLDFDDFLNENNLKDTDIEILSNELKISETQQQDKSNKGDKLNKLQIENNILNFNESSFSQKLNSALNDGNSKNLDKNWIADNITKKINLQNVTPEMKVNSISTENVILKDINLDYLDNLESNDSIANQSSSLIAFNDEEERIRILNIAKKSKKTYVPEELKDDKYWARRKKNNVAAKRSRDARRLNENQIAQRATMLEYENEILKKQLEEIKKNSMILKLKLARYESSGFD